jgi:hypothetical protein
MSRTQLERTASGDLDNLQIAVSFGQHEFVIEEEGNAPLAAAVADNRSRGQPKTDFADNPKPDNALLPPTWFGERWSGNYPDGIVEWKWADGARNGPISLDTWGDENGTTSWASIIRSSNADFPPGFYKVHHCAHKPCKCSFSPTSMFGLSRNEPGFITPLHLFGVDSGIGMLNVPQSRNAAEADAVAEPSTPSPPSPPSPPSTILGFSKSKKGKNDKTSKKDKQFKKAKKPKKIKNAATYTNNAKNKNKANDNGKGSGDMTVICVPDKAMDGGQEFQLTVEASDTIGDVKRKLFLLTSILQTNQRLGFAGKCLADNKTLAFYNIPDGAKITYISKAAVAAAAARRRVKNEISKIVWHSV